MDITSYLLGKKQGGFDWSEIGYDEPPTTINDKIDYAKNILKTWSPDSNLYRKFMDNKELTFMPLVDTSIATKMNGMFKNCVSLIYVPQLDTSNNTQFGEMFYGCTSLTTVPDLDTRNGTIFGSMFAYCNSLKLAPILDTSNATEMRQMFMNDTWLTSVPKYNAQNVVDIQSVVYNCSRLKHIGGFKDLGKAYLTTKSANNAYYTLSVTSSSVTHESLLNVINNLYDIATKGCNTQTLSLGSTNIAKLTAEEIEIATSKGWTVS